MSLEGSRTGIAAGIKRLILSTSGCPSGVFLLAAGRPDDAAAQACFAIRAAAIRARPAGRRVAAADLAVEDLAVAQRQACSAARVVLAHRVVAVDPRAVARPVAVAAPAAVAHPVAPANPAAAAAPFGAAGPVDAAGWCGSDCSEPDWRDARRVAR